MCVAALEWRLSVRRTEVQRFPDSMARRVFSRSQSPDCPPVTSIWVTWNLGDLEELPFSDAEFDLVTGFNSFQFAANPVVALQEARRVAKPTGRVVIMTWGVPEGMEAASLVAALKPLLPPPPPGAPGRFALSDANTLRALAESAWASWR